MRCESAAVAAVAQANSTAIEFRLASFTPQSGWQERKLQNSQQTIYLADAVIIAAADIALANAGFTEDGMPSVFITMTESGRKKFAVATGRSIGKPIAIVVNGQVLSAPVVRETIDGGRVMLTGMATAREAKEIADGLSR